jgi:cytochrome c
MHFLVRHANLIFAAAFLLPSLSSAYAREDDVKAQVIAKQNACLGCHATNKKIVGPAFQDIAKRYANDPNAKIFLRNKILKGGAGSWGVVPMPANTKLNDSDLNLLLPWVLRGAPSAN